MANFHDPALIAKDFAALINFVHCVDGIFIWEFFVSLNFDGDYFTGRRKFKWSFVLHFLSRFAALGHIICNLIFYNVTHLVNCQALIILTHILGYTGLACAWVLVSLRAIAIWHHNYLVEAVVIGICSTNIGFLIYGIVTVRSTWSRMEATCVLENTLQSRDNITATMASDIAILVIMLVGLLRSRKTKYGILQHLYGQGLIWLAPAIIAQIPATVLIYLNLSDPWNVMFQDFALFTMIICATRMYRALIAGDAKVEGYTPKPTALSQLRFIRTPPQGASVTAASNSALPKSRLETYPYPEDVELNLTEKTTVVGDEEAQSHKMSSQLSRDG